MAVVLTFLRRFAWFQVFALVCALEQEEPACFEVAGRSSRLTRRAGTVEPGYMGRGQATGRGGWWSYAGTAHV